jgi:hypothetical protein
MPYKLEGNCVVRADTGATVKCHPTRAQAKRHLIALKINVEGKEAKLSAITRLVTKVTGSDRARKRVEGGASSRERMGMGPSPGQPTGTASPALVALAKKVWVEAHKSVTKTGEVYDVKGHWRNVKPGEVGVEVGEWRAHSAHPVTKDTPKSSASDEPPSGPWEPGASVVIRAPGSTSDTPAKVVRTLEGGKVEVRTYDKVDPVRVVDARNLHATKEGTTVPDEGPKPGTLGEAMGKVERLPGETQAEYNRRYEKQARKRFRGMQAVRRPSPPHAPR